jgi:hypothetical protein
MPGEWTIDLARMEARHRSGLVVRFTPDRDGSGAWDGAPVVLPPDLDSAAAARLMREAGDAMLAAIRSAPKS